MAEPVLGRWPRLLPPPRRLSRAGRIPTNWSSLRPDGSAGCSRLIESSGAQTRRTACWGRKNPFLLPARCSPARPAGCKAAPTTPPVPRQKALTAGERLERARLSRLLLGRQAALLVRASPEIALGKQAGICRPRAVSTHAAAPCPTPEPVLPTCPERPRRPRGGDRAFSARNPAQPRLLTGDGPRRQLRAAAESSLRSPGVDDPATRSLKWP